MQAAEEDQHEAGGGLIDVIRVRSSWPRVWGITALPLAAVL
jgi:hypothetical protein